MTGIIIDILQTAAILILCVIIRNLTRTNQSVKQALGILTTTQEPPVLRPKFFGKEKHPVQRKEPAPKSTDWPPNY